MCKYYSITARRETNPSPTGPPPPGAAVAVGALAFKQWLDNLFHSKKIEGNLVEDHQGLHVYGLFDQMKCQEANKFIQAICSYDWGPAPGHNAGTLFVAPGNESKMSFTTQVVGPFRGQ